jgi:hypothetical protein
MKAWRVHDFGEPQDQLALDEIPEPTGAALAGLSMGLGGWIPCGPRARALRRLGHHAHGDGRPGPARRDDVPRHVPGAGRAPVRVGAGGSRHDRGRRPVAGRRLPHRLAHGVPRRHPPRQPPFSYPFHLAHLGLHERGVRAGATFIDGKLQERHLTKLKVKLRAGEEVGTLRVRHRAGRCAGSGEAGRGIC